MGGEYSASGAQSISNASGAKIGPVYFAPATFGSQGSAGGGTTTYLLLAAAAVAAWWFLGRGK